MNIYAMTVTRANTAARAQLLLRTLTEARNTAKAPFFWHLFTQEQTLAANICQSALELKLIDKLTLWPDNRGQHVAFNAALTCAKTEGAKHLLRLDDDVEFITRGWLRKLSEAMAIFKDVAILAPQVIGLKHPPERFTETDVDGIPVEFLTSAIGGVCRLHPVALLDKGEYVSDVRLPLGSGDATGIGTWCQNNGIPMAWIKTARVRHLTVKQDENDPEHKVSQNLAYLIPYVPPWSPTCE